MIQELASKIWNNPDFQKSARNAELDWIKKDVGLEDVHPDQGAVKRLTQAASILACSENPEHRKAAFRIATSLYESWGTIFFPLDQALHLILSRLGNFPSLATRKEVESAQSAMPLSLVLEECSAAESRSIKINNNTIYLTNFQHSLWSNLSAGNRLAISAPTSAGKSFVLLNYLVWKLSQNEPVSIVYLVPTRALIAQVADDIAKEFKIHLKNPPDILTIPPDAETAISKRAVYVFTQERTQMALASQSQFQADLVIVDEAHSISDGARGILLQWVIDDLLERNENLQILFASPTIRNLDIFGKVFGLPNLEEISSVEPTVAQNFLLVEIDSSTKGRITLKTIGDGFRERDIVSKVDLEHSIASKVDKLVHIASKLGSNQSNIVYANGAADSEKIAIQLMDLFFDRKSTPKQLALSELAKEAIHPNYALVECVKKGIAFHYSNIPTQVRLAIEEAVSSGDINYLVCTSTLLQGVNLPVKNMFMHMPEKGKSNPLESTDFWNLAGRAGRLRREFQGNIFLIDYENWKKKPLDGPKDSVIKPSFENCLMGEADKLVSVIEDKSGKAKDDMLESAFVKLYSDHKRGSLAQSLDKMGISQDSESYKRLSEALAAASEQINLPETVIRRTPNISAHKQQRLYQYFVELNVSDDISIAKKLIPCHPRDSQAFNSYSEILEICHRIILDIDTSKNLHRFHALIAKRWMTGMALPQIIDEQIKRNSGKKIQTTIRETLSLVENQIRFETVRLMNCYCAVLGYLFEENNYQELLESIPSIPLYLEVGASDKTMISFMALGLSRVTATKLNELSARKDLDMEGALNWLVTRPIDSFGLSPFLLEEVRKILSKR